MISEFDENEQGGLTFEDFLRIMNTRPKNTENKDHVKKVFKKYDNGGKQYIDINDLKKFVNNLKLGDVEDSLLELIIKNCSSEGNGRLSFNDFYNVMMAETYH